MQILVVYRKKAVVILRPYIMPIVVIATLVVVAIP